MNLEKALKSIERSYFWQLLILAGSETLEIMKDINMKIITIIVIAAAAICGNKMHSVVCLVLIISMIYSA